MTPWLRGLSALVLLLAAPTLFADEGVTLRWKLEKGQTHAYLMKHREVRTTQVRDQKFETTTQSEYEWQWHVQDVDDRGLATLEHKFTAIRMTCTARDFEYQYDSSRANNYDDEHRKKLTGFLDQLRHGTYRLKMNPLGRLAEVQGFDRLIAEVAEGTLIADFYALNLHDGSFGWFLQRALGVLPEKPTTAGGKWKAPAQGKWQGLGELTGESDFTLGAVKEVGGRPCREFDITGAYTFDADMKWGHNLLRGTLKTDKLAGKVRFDTKAGRVQSSEVNAVVGGEVKVGVNEKPLPLKMTFEHRLVLEAKP